MITLSNINEKTDQDVFDYIVGALLKQNKQSADSDNMCQYKSKDGCKCAVGQVISDEEYDKKMEGQTIRGAFFDKFNIDVDKLFFLQELQEIHDDCDVINWAKQFKELANKLDLNYKF